MQDMVHIISVTKVIQLIFIYSLRATLHDLAFGDSPPIALVQAVPLIMDMLVQSIIT